MKVYHGPYLNFHISGKKFKMNEIVILTAIFFHGL